MNTLKLEAALAKKYKYKPLPQELSENTALILKKIFLNGSI